VAFFYQIVRHYNNVCFMIYHNYDFVFLTVLLGINVNLFGKSINMRISTYMGGYLVISYINMVCL